MNIAPPLFHRSPPRIVSGEWFRNLLAYLPTGNSLPREVWLVRHRAILWLVWIQAASLLVFALVQGYALGHAVFEASTIAMVPALVESLRVRNQTVRASAACIGLVTSSAVLTHLSGGFIEAHFHFFVMLAVIALYQSWVPFLMSVLYVVIHHGVAGAFDPTSVYNHPDAIAHPWKWAGIHAGFVSAACICYIVAWRWNEMAQAQSRHILNAAGEGIIGLDPEGNVLFANPAAEKLIGRDASLILGTPIVSVLRVSGAAGQSAESIDSLAPEGAPVEATLERGEERIPIELFRTVNDERAGGARDVVIIRDITHRKQGEEAIKVSEQRFRSLVHNASDMITVVAPDLTIRYQSPSMERVLDLPPSELLGGKLLDLFHPEDAPSIGAFLTEAMSRPNHPATIEVRVKHRDGSWHDLEVIGTDLRSDPSVGGFVLNSRDISERKALETELRHQAFHDSLTGLANRASFFDRLENALPRSQRHRTGLAVMFLDLDDFKSMNDGFGHDAGDQLLQEVANRISSCLRPGDTAARLGGDEFAILLDDLEDKEGVGLIAERLLSKLHGRHLMAGKEFTVTASLGIVTTWGEDVTAGELIRDADIAMYKAKGDGGGRYAFYTPDLYAHTLERLELLTDLQDALARDEFEVRYQPTIVLDTGEIAGFEALVRWRHPRRGLLLPGMFIHLAEESSLILPLGRWVLLQACLTANRLHEEFPSRPELTMNVNVSVRQLQEQAFIQDVKNVLDLTKLNPAHLTLEVTESVMMDNTRLMTERLGELKKLGVRLAIDDFGTGYSSLSYLRQFPFDILKVDKAFINNGEDEDGRDLARGIIELGRTLHLEIVAEGIERADQVAKLQLLACELGQGFYFSEPVTNEGVNELMRQAVVRSQVA